MTKYLPTVYTTGGFIFEGIVKELSEEELKITEESFTKLSDMDYLTLTTKSGDVYFNACNIVAIRIEKYN